MEGWLSEIGPCVFQDGFQKTLNGSFNPYTWLQNSSLIWLEAPVGVGFSYSPNMNDISFNDNVTETQMFLSLQVFFQKFPELLGNDFYIAGESYAGIYIPRLAYRIYMENQNVIVSNYQTINLKGILVGNGVASMETLFYTTNEYFFYHQFIPATLYNQFVNSCSQNQNSAECTRTQNEINKLTATVNPYDVYGYCFNDYTTDDSCATSIGWTNLLRIPTVQQALHVSQHNITWNDCSNYVGNKYVSIPPGSVPYYLFLKDKIKILVFTGDADSVVPYTDTYLWLYSNFDVLKEAEVWYVPSGEQAGWVTQFDGITYLTVRGAGHMVPAFRRLQALTFFTGFINDIAPFNWQP